MKKITVLILFLTNSLLLGIDIQQQNMLEDLAILKNSICTKYAPKDWKNTLFQWDLATEYENAKANILLNHVNTTDGYQKVFKKFMTSMRDYHVGPTFSTRELSIYPILIAQAEGRYFIIDKDFSFDFGLEGNLLVDSEKITDWLTVLEKAFQEQQINYEVGDELLFINGIPTQTVVENIIDTELGGSRSPTDYALATAMLFKRMGKYGHITPQGNFEITIMPKGGGHAVTFSLPWLYFSEDILKREMNFASKRHLENPKSLSEVRQSLSKDFNVSIAEDFIPRKPVRNTFLLNSQLFVKNTNETMTEYVTGFLPPLGKIVWKATSKSPIYAYVYKNNQGKKIGYIYLPSFKFENEAIEEKVLLEIAKILKLFNKNTEALVFDITNNPGGSDLVMNTILSMLSDKNIENFLEQEIITQKDVYRALFLLKYVDLLKEEMEKEKKDFDVEEFNHLKTYLNLIVEAFKSGKTLTDPIHLYGLNEIKPNSEVVYRKPILVLINELDFSCGDFFAALIQDNKIGTLFGKKTAGAGGYVLTYSNPSLFGVSEYSLTGSIGYRLDGTPIENIGVTPDILYEFTIRDLQLNYPDYSEAVNNEITNLINQ